MQSKGILIGCDENQEWMLPWWWKNYSLHNTLPVAFVDFGLSEEGVAWCAGRGKVLSLPDYLPELKARQELCGERVMQWEKAYGDGFWRSRPCWFKKPHALLQTPFAKTLWLDLDCEVRGDVSGLFAMEVGIGLVPEPSFAHDFLRGHGLIETNEVCYNSGVILYRHGADAVVAWAKDSFCRADDFWSDQHLLSRQIFERDIEVRQLSDIYNWRMACGKNEEAIIVHWVGDVGKECILAQIWEEKFRKS